jgi:hypothetical protein
MNGNPNETVVAAAQQQTSEPAPAQVQPPQAWPAQAAPHIQPRDPRAKSPALACILSAVPGLGQVYVGYYARGFVHAVVTAALFTFLTSNTSETIMPLALIFMIFFWLYNIIDAGRRAAMFNEALAGNTTIDLPKDIDLPSLGGSITGGILFITAGAILLSHTLFEIPLEWLENWWPAAGIAFGAYLLIKGIVDRRATTTGAASRDTDKED